MWPLPRFGQIAWCRFPYDPGYFVVLPNKSTPVIGEIDLQSAATREKFVRAGKAAKLSELIKQEYQRCQF